MEPQINTDLFVTLPFQFILLALSVFIRGLPFFPFLPLKGAKMEKMEDTLAALNSQA
jgi:hypothetical protein